MDSSDGSDRQGAVSTLDLDALRTVVEGLSAVVGLPTKIVAHPDGEVLAAAGGGPACEGLRRLGLTTEEVCAASDRAVLADARDPAVPAMCSCPNGLVRAAVPIAPEGDPVAYLVAGPALLEPPDPARVETVATERGVAAEEYGAVLAAAPVVPAERLRAVASFFAGVAGLLAERGRAVVREAEERTRAELERREAGERAERLRRENEVLALVACSEAVAEGDVEAAARLLTERASAALGVERVGVWLFEGGGTRLVNLDNYVASTAAHSSGAVLEEREFRDELAALKNALYVDAHDALADPRTAGYVAGYLRPNRITSMLDGAIRACGECLGSLCFEHVDRPHRWTEDEIAFACQLADQVALALANRDRRAAEEARLLLESRIQQAQKLESLGVLAGGIAHDFNNLLVGILGNADLALRDMAPEAPATESVRLVVASAERAADLVRQMLAYAGKGRFVVERISLNAVVEEMVHLLEVSISKKAVLRLDLTREIPPVEADATQLRQVVMNLVTNASEAVGARSGLVRVATGAMDCDRAYLKHTFVDWSLPEGPYVYLEVSDTGCGMAPETVQRIFDPFFTTKFAGRGLGLAAVLGIVRSHRGGLKVYSEPGRGTTIKVLLPAAEGEPNGANGKPPPTPVPGAGGTVLLVDDEDTVRLVGRRMLERLGFAVVTAVDGAEALELFKAEPDRFVAVLLDLTMPRMDGDACFRELRRVRPGVRVLLASGYNEQELVSRFAGKGLAGFIQKPYRLSTLAERLAAVLGAEPPER